VIRALSIALFLTMCAVVPAAAHPHIFIDAKATVVFDNTGAIVGFRHAWTFDEGFSAWSIQGLDTNGDGQVSSAEMQELADQNMEGLSEYAYYTFAGEGEDNLPLGQGINPVLKYENGRTTLYFDLPLQTPYRMQKRFEIAINDPEYYVAITFGGASDVTLENAPAGCGVMLEEPKDLAPELEDQLYALPPDVTQLPPDLAAALRGTQGAIVVSCPGGAAPATSALDAANAMAAVSQTVTAPPKPFGGPPPEPGLPLPRTGVLGWIAQLQADFYLGLQDALARLKTDFNAFWILGGLSFLYGVFHAAGPGHGKVVISSYVLASEQQLRRGVLLSFISAFIQSLVAIAFVLIAAAVLNLSSMAMSSIANWIGIASYGLVMLLGVYLVVRKLFFGHRHAHHERGHRDTAALAHRHLHDDEDDDHDGHHHDHHHHHHSDEDEEHDHSGHMPMVTPGKLRGDWREQAAVVIGVGLRPCSGALIVLVFALSQGLLAAGIAAVLLMGLGTGITVAVLATIAATGKGLAQRIGGRQSRIAAAIVWWLELLGAVAVFAFGLLFLLASV
jgi:ABC-type nickel/cobalt efflux system permease component RcnA/ABC-type uncharacterized transport system substrate-binding protein